MPPAAISRSSTYLPKIWGNIARLHGSALGLALLLSGCSNPPEDRVLPLRAERPPACGSGDPTTIQLEALGDFEASALTSETLTGPSPSGTDLSFPPETLAVEARGEGSSTTFLGVGEVGPGGGIDLLLLPEDSACELYRPSSTKPYPLATGGEAIGFSRAQRVLLIAGGSSPSGDSARALTLDVDTAETAEVPDGMIPGRAFASVSEFGPEALLVAGGLDPGAAPASAVETAIVYEIAERRFDRVGLIPLARARARHAAVVLENGETLLVGGADETALSALEAVSPTDRAARVSAPTLFEARISPIAFRLDDGRVFVGGGVSDDGTPVQSLEWLSPNGGDHLRALTDVRVAQGSAFVAMPGGSVLAVGVCALGESKKEGRPDCVPGRVARKVAWIRADYTVDPLPPLAFEPEAPVLVPAADGAPFLIVTTPAGSRTVLRFDPWTGTFGTPDEAPVAPEADQGAPIATDPGVFVWLAPFGDALRIDAFRHGTRNVYSRDIAPLLLGGPAHIVPDRAPGNQVKYDGALVLEGTDSEPAPRVVIADTTYDDLELEMEIDPESDPPRVALGRAIFGDLDCLWPTGEGALLVVRRIDSSVTLERDGRITSCAIAPGRVAIGVIAPRLAGNSARVKSLRISRAVR